jgi:DNA-binding SARP family transcriptional activator
MISCRTLGPVQITVNGMSAPAELCWRKPLALLIYLARSPGRTQTRAHLAGLLWGDRPEADARHSLSEAIRLIRRSAGSGIEGTLEQIRLAPEAVRLDVEEFEALASRQRWIEAAGLVRGEFLQGFGIAHAPGFEDWLAAERAGWSARSVHALVAAAEAHMGEGDADPAAARAQFALQLDPESGPAAGALRRAQALGGIAGPPRDRTMEVERIRRPPLVGRDRQLEALLEIWRECCRGRRGGLVLVEGEPGSGRSRLLEEAAARVRHDGGAVAAVRAIPPDALDPLGTVRAILRGDLSRLPGLGGADPGALATLIGIDPRLRERFPGADRAEPLEPVAALRELLRTLAEERPLLLTVDDAHFADPASLDALSATLRDLGDCPLLLALSAEPEPPVPRLEALRARLGRDVAGSALRLAPLEPAELRRLVAWAFPSYPPEQTDRLARRLARDSGRLPLYAVELLHAVALGHELDSTGPPWPAPDRTLDHTFPAALPPALSAAIRINFRRLSADAQAVLAAASVLEERCDTERVARGAGLDVERAGAALDELEWQRWVEAESRGYAFVARVVRNLIAADFTTAGQRRRILERAGPAPQT